MTNERTGGALRSTLAYALATALLALPSAPLGAQGFDWARRIAASGSVETTPVAIDPAGNVYVAGGFDGTLTLGEGEANETTLVSDGFNAFFAVYGPDGELVWARQNVSAGNSSARDVTVGGGILYVTGILREPTTFGAGEINETTLTPGKNLNFYVTAFDQAGGLIWAKQHYLDSEETIHFFDGTSVAADALGNLYVTGWLPAADGDSLVFDAGEPATVIPIAVGDNYVPYLARFDASGTLLWADANPPRTSADAPSASITPLDIAAGPNGDAFVTGMFSGDVVFGAGEVNETTLTTEMGQLSPETDVFVARYDTAGDLVWVREGNASGSGFGWVSSTGIAVDDGGNSYVTGTFDTELVLGPGEVNETALAAVGSTGGTPFYGDAFLAKLDATGNLVWARQDGGSDGDWGRAIALDNTGNPFVAGTFGATATFGLGEPAETTLWAVPRSDPNNVLQGWDVFVSSYDTNGSLRWARRAGGPERQDAVGIAVDAAGEARVSGDFWGSIVFGPGEPGETILADSGTGSAYLASFSAEPATIDTDGDGLEDADDPDDDNDGVPDDMDDYPVGRFVDARPGYWAFTFIEDLARAGITGGCGTGNYCPEEPVTRAQMAVFLERGIHGSAFSPPAATGSVFTDVAAEDFAASFIEQLYVDGVTGGCGGGAYCPPNPVTRAQMAVFLLRAKHGAGYTPPAPSGVFGDVDPASYWAAAWIEQLAAEGITSGCGGGAYCPEAPVTRAQMAVFLVRTFGL